jgi:hypothetical protein
MLAQSHNLTSTPAELGIRLDKNENTAAASMVSEYRKQIGSLMYLMTKTRPDIAFAVNCCARFMSNPDATHYRALDRIWKYLAGTVDYSLVYTASEHRLHLSGFVDSDWGGVIIQPESRLLGTSFSTQMLRYHGLARFRRLWHCLLARQNTWH